MKYSVPLKEITIKTLENELKLNDRFAYYVNPGDYISITKELLDNKNLFTDIDKISKNFKINNSFGDEEIERLTHYAGLLQNYENVDTGREPDKSCHHILNDFETYRYFFKEIAASLKFNPLSNSAAGSHVLEKIYSLLIDYISLIKPKVLFKYIDVTPDENGLQINGTDIHFDNRKLSIFTSHSSPNMIEEINSADILGKKVIVYVATIGTGIDDEVKLLTKKGEMFDAYLLNGIGAGAAEMTAIDLNRYMNDNRSEENYEYERLSPGYGNWNISDQAKIFKLLDPERYIGVTLTDSYIMLPEKTTSGIMGLIFRENSD